jgi:hypothetical protein
MQEVVVQGVVVDKQPEQVEQVEEDQDQHHQVQLEHQEEQIQVEEVVEEMAFRLLMQAELEVQEPLLLEHQQVLKFQQVQAQIQ